MLIAVQSGERGKVDEVIAELAATLARGGLSVAGLVQSNVDREDRCRCDMVLRELASGREIGISQDLGSGSRGCRLDPGALETAVGWVQASLSPAIDALVLNKFGKREAEGAGLRPAIASAVALGIPVVVGLGAENQAAWDAFCGGDGEVIQASEIAQVAERLLTRRARTATSQTLEGATP